MSSVPSSVGPDELGKYITNIFIAVPPHSPRRSAHLLDINATPKSTKIAEDRLPCSPRSAPATSLRPSPSMSVIPHKSAPATRIRANSLTTCSLAERRRSKTSAYLGTEDFKQNFANKLRSVRARERTESGEAILGRPLKGPSWKFPSQSDGAFVATTVSFDRDFPFNRNYSEEKVSGLPLSDVPTRGEALREMINHLLALPTEELAAQLEMHFSRLEPGRDAEELEARNEVISTLADQLANQLEANEKLLFDLRCLRSAHANLSFELADSRDELACMVTAVNGAAISNDELVRVRREADTQIRDLRHALEESKHALAQLRLEQTHKDRRSSIQSYQAALNNMMSHSIGQKRSSVFLLGTDRTNVQPKRASLSAVGLGLYQPPNLSDEKAWTARNDPRNARRPGLLSAPGKPARPPRSLARSGSFSPVNPEDLSNKPTDKEELELLRLQCTHEDFRLASQAALDALKTFISSSGPMDVSSVKLPPLPTDIESSSPKPRWGILGRTFISGPSSPSAATATAFAGFGLWGKKSRESEESQGN
ncbi:hypothetical protein CROQUDRAFT_101186 [Cronartium quercuum f. sp. fusiforme G11]|uniref:Uncharacterized protein n=1 Tax=Cronartium quercuum f. sp. fusiforme G11 TaxID=708437 RepID=A0A9P6N6F5_9BASI|nr:hypothetical protein CROQUDRAFT_101186 [Cronartium quercuum f. sp. fusiforme G11]